MKAIVCTKYGPPEVLKLEDVPQPEPRPQEVLIRVCATTCHFGDVRVRGAILPMWMQLPFRLFMGIRGPRCRVLGMELSGTVEAVGADVRRFSIGDAVVACTGYSMGAYAEFIRLPENAANASKGLVAPKPVAMSFGEAAAGIATGGLTALSMLRKANVQPRQRVLVYGASGSVGVYAVQLAKHFGADVTGVCSARNLDMVRSIGAENVIDYTNGELQSCTETFDVVLDAVGKLPRVVAKRLTVQHGCLLDVHRDVGPVRSMTTAELQFLVALADNGELRTFIDRCYPLERIVEAHGYVQQGHKRGHVVIDVDGSLSV